MVRSPSQQKFSKPDQRASRTIAIKPDVRGVKQLDNGIDDTFVSSVREEVFRRFGRFSELARWRKTVCLRHEDTAVDTKVWAIPSSNCAAHFVLAEWR
jgi:hypothetical protein